MLRLPFNPAARPLPRDQRLNRKNNTTMSDPVTSGNAASTVPAETVSATPSVGAQAATQPFGSFGATRGSGLLRGKAKRPAAPAAASTAPSGYQPSSIEVITSKSEYKNPFTGETSVASPVSPQPVAQVINEPVAPAVPQAVVAPAPVARPIVAPTPVVTPAQVAAPAPASRELFPLDESSSAQKSELNILPPADSKRPAQSWESNGHGRTDERPTFRPEPRQPRRPDPREPRAQREQSAEARPAQPRVEREHREPRREEPKKSGGFIAWLKGLFGGGDKPVTNGTVGTDESRRDGEYRHGRRRHRGGRGRSQGFNGPRDNQSAEGGRPQEGGRPHGSESQPQGEDGGHRRRRRGGRNRHRGDRGGQPRSDGQQGGGAI